MTNVRQQYDFHSVIESRRKKKTKVSPSGSGVMTEWGGGNGRETCTFSYSFPAFLSPASLPSSLLGSRNL